MLFELLTGPILRREPTERPSAPQLRGSGGFYALAALHRCLPLECRDAQGAPSILEVLAGREHGVSYPKDMKRLPENK